jgi:protein TonB
MEAKKNPAQDVYRYTFRNFLIGLSVSVSLALIAFEWTTEKLDQKQFAVTEPSMESYMAVLSSVKEEPKPVSLEVKKQQPAYSSLVESTSSESSTEPEPTIDWSDVEFDNSDTEISTLMLPDEDTTAIIITAEVQPKPVGGFEQFYSQIKKNIKYPRQAIKYDVQGKVFVEFVVDRHGNASQFKVIKGIGSGCDEEAMRVLALTKWEPGKQRGKPVNVRMVLPVSFMVQ